MSEITQLLLNFIVILHQVTGNLGWAIIAFTLIFRALLFPLSYHSGKKMHETRLKQKELQPELKRLKEKFKNKPQEFSQAQLELYRKYNMNPLSGCLPQILQMVILIFLYHIFTSVLKSSDINGFALDTHFLWFDLTQKDPLYILPVLAAASQLFFSLMLAPGAETLDLVPNKSKKKVVQEANKKEEDMAEMAESMQKQMLFMMPLITGFMAIQFPAGLVVYWVITTILSIAQQFIISGPGGLSIYAQRLRHMLGAKKDLYDSF